LHLVDHLEDAFHNLIAGQDLAAFGHECGNGLAVACSLQDEICYKRDTFGIVELDPSYEPSRATCAASATISLSFSRGVRFMGFSVYMRL
jgi:hypothetical protein